MGQSFATCYTTKLIGIHKITSWISWLCLSSLRLFMIRTMAACRYIFRSSSIAWCVCSTSCNNITIKYVKYVYEYVFVFVKLIFGAVWYNQYSMLFFTCGVSRWTVPAIRNFVLLLLYFMFRLITESEDNSYWKKCKGIRWS